MIKPAVFLDRDNTLIHNDGDLGDPDRVVLIKGVASAVASLRGLGYAIVVVTNQGGVARGEYTEDDIDAVHERINALLRPTNGAIVDRFYYCPYHPEGRVKHYTREHPNRKPQPGMLLEAARELNLDLSQSWMIGDQVRDVQAGKAAGVRTILLRDDAPHLVPLDVDETEGIQRLPEEVMDAASGHEGDQDQGQPPVDRPHYYARSLIEAVRLVAQQRKPEAAGELAAEERATRKWDAQAVAKMREQREAERNAEASGAGQGTKRVMVGTSSTSRRGESGRPFEPAGHYHERAQDQSAEPGKKTHAASPEPNDPEERAAEAPPLTQADTHALEPHELEDAQAQAQPAEPIAKPEPPLAEEPDESPPAAGLAPDQEQQAASEPEAAPASKAKTGRTPPADATLRQILQEVRDFKASQHDFSYPAMLAIVLQVVAVVCLAAGLWLGASTDDFLRWLGSGLMAQLAAITALLFARVR